MALFTGLVRILKLNGKPETSFAAANQPDAAPGSEEALAVASQVTGTHGIKAVEIEADEFVREWVRTIAEVSETEDATNQSSWVERRLSNYDRRCNRDRRRGNDHDRRECVMWFEIAMHPPEDGHEQN